MKIELLYPRITTLYGEIGNVNLLKTCLKDAQFIETQLDQEPYFVHHKPDLIYMGPMTERHQLKIIDRLMPYRERLIDLIQEGVTFLITGNALDLFGESIEDDQHILHPGLSIFAFKAIEDRLHRHNSLVLAQYKGMDMVGFKTQFTQLYPTGQISTWMNVDRGTGFNIDSKFEGIHKNRFYGTNCIGPLLIMNPYFTLDLLKSLGISHPKLPYQEALIAAYHQRVSEFKNPQIINYP